MTIPNISEEIIYITTKEEALKYLPASEKLTSNATKNTRIIYWFIGGVIITVLLYTCYLSKRTAIPLHRQKSTD